jgi:hypothetical protein
MTNGTVQKGNGTTLVVQYQDGSKTISVPASVAVTEVAPEKVTLARVSGLSSVETQQERKTSSLARL